VVKRIFLHLSALALFGLLGSPSYAAQRVYSVIFEVSEDGQGKVTDVTVAKVIDPMSGSTKPVQVSVSETYLASARAEIARRAEARRSAGETSKPHYFTYFYYDPRLPDRLDVLPIPSR
jgi:hypothetical protein